MSSRIKFLIKACALLPLLALSPLDGARTHDYPTAPAPELPDTLDLPTAIRYGLDNNFSIQQAKERIREQEGLIVQVKAQALPNATIDSLYTKSDPELSSDRSSPSSPPPFGGKPDNTQNWQIALTVRQLLYSGGGIKAAVNAQAALREAALLDLQATINAALFEVRTRFYNVLLAREQIRVQESNVQLLGEQLQIARNRFQAGASSNFEVLRAEVAAANAQPALIRARNGYRTTIDQLRQSLGYASSRAEVASKVPEIVGSLDITPVSFELESSLIAARTNRPEIRRLARIEDARAAGVRNAQSGYYPDLSLVGGYLYRKNNFSNRIGESLDGWTIGLQSQWSIFDGRATSGRVAQARSQLRQSQLLTAESTLGIEVEVRTSLSSLQEAAELASAATKVVGQAEEAVRLADARYGAGTITQLDVLESRNALTDSRLNQLQANYSYNVALATMRRAVGQSDPIVIRP